MSPLERARALLAEGRGGEAVEALCQALSRSEHAALAREVAALVEPTVAAPAELRRHYADLWDGGKPHRGRAQRAARALGRLKQHRAALQVLSAAFQDDDGDAAGDRARLHLALGELDAAVQAADRVLSGMLRTRMPIARFVREAQTRKPEEVLRFTRAQIARLPELRDAVAVRWEALRRAGRKDEAAAMRALCVRYWPERISVWETAGNHALDDAQPDQALAFFTRALALDPTSTAAHAGKAIAHEMRKEWSSALEHRREVAELEHAFEGSDAASLHRTLRYAANLGRLGRWSEAAPYFHRCAARGAFDKAPHERAALLRAFTSELYAPAWIAAFAARVGGPPETPAVRLALRDAEQLRLLGERIDGLALAPRERAIAQGMCALQAGDLQAAYRAFDHADGAEGDDMIASCLLASSAHEVGAGDAAGASDFARQLARRELEARASEARRFYAALALARGGERDALGGITGEPFGSLIRELDRPQLSLSELALLAERWCGRSSELEALAAWTALREASAALGHAPGLPALACAPLRLRTH